MSMRRHSASLLIAAAITLAGCAGDSSASFSATDGFWSRGREANFKTTYGLDLVLPVPEETFLNAIAHTGLQVSRLGEPGSNAPVIPPSRLDFTLDQSRVSHAWSVYGGYHERPTRFNEKYLAYVVDGQVVAVENDFGYYAMF